jgi:hypothetical protein
MGIYTTPDYSKTGGFHHQKKKNSFSILQQLWYLPGIFLIKNIKMMIQHHENQLSVKGSWFFFAITLTNPKK